MVDTTNTKPGLFNKITNLYEKGKQKIKEKLKTGTANRLGTKDMNIKMSVQSSKSKTTPTKIVSGTSSGKVDDFFVIEDEEDVKKYVLQDSDDEYSSDSDTKKEKVTRQADSKSTDQDSTENETNEVVTIKDTATIAEKKNTNVNEEHTLYNPAEDEFYNQENLDDYSICHKLLLKVSVLITSNYRDQQ